jgi:hypothetical protein
MIEDVLQVWRVHEEINLFLLERIPEAGFQAVTLLKSGQPSTGRTVARVFAHMHGVRVAHVGRDFLVPGFRPRGRGAPRADRREPGAYQGPARHRPAGLPHRARIAPPGADPAGAEAIRSPHARRSTIRNLGAR